MPLSIWYPPLYSQLLWDQLPMIPHLTEIMQYSSFCAWLASLSKVNCTFIHVVANDRIPCNNIPSHRIFYYLAENTISTSVLVLKDDVPRFMAVLFSVGAQGLQLWTWSHFCLTNPLSLLSWASSYATSLGNILSFQPKISVMTFSAPLRENESCLPQSTSTQLFSPPLHLS